MIFSKLCATKKALCSTAASVGAVSKEAASSLSLALNRAGISAARKAVTARIYTSHMYANSPGSFHTALGIMISAALHWEGRVSSSRDAVNNQMANETLLIFVDYILKTVNLPMAQLAGSNVINPYLRSKMNVFQPPPLPTTLPPTAQVSINGTGISPELFKENC